MNRNVATLFVLIFLLCVSVITANSAHGQDLETTEKYIEGSDVMVRESLDLWHYSGGYWKVGNAGSDKIVVSDTEMLNRGIDGVMADEYAEFDINIPASAQAIINEGGQVVPKAFTYSAALETLFDMESAEMLLEDGSLFFKVKPKFNLVPQRELSFLNYNLNLSNEVPLIDREYGYNIYSLFGNGESGAQAAGRLSRWDPDAVEAGYVHPSMITGLNGALEGGHTIYIRGSAVGSAGYRVGDGTFAAGGAVGLSFSYPVLFRFYEVVEAEEPPEDPPEEPPEPEEDVTVSAHLDLPPQTYEGHRVYAVDSSLFEIEGETLSALRAYGEDLADNRFSLVENGIGSIHRKSSIQAEAVFSQAGHFHVQLDVDTRSGHSGRDVQPIRVLATPAIRHTLTGVQKQNRKQVLSLAVAQNPAYPLSDLWVELTDPDTGETLRLEHHFGSSANTLQNGARIKTRPLADVGSTEETVCVELPFLTKNATACDFVYRVFAEDVRGHTDSVEVVFPVARDEAPRAAIDLPETWLREKGSNIARIEAADVSVTDGDQLSRQWIYRATAIDDTPLAEVEGYQDLSFGGGSRVAFDREGVGPFELELQVRDVWTEETLPEYILPEDHLADVGTASALVDNVAPVVHMEPVRSRELDVLLFAEDSESLQEARAGSTELRSLLLAEGVEPNIIVEQVLSDDPEQAEIEKLGILEVSYGFQGTWSGFWEDRSVTCDEERIYKAEATWTPGTTDYDCYPEQPYVLRAYSARTMEPLWNYTLSAGHFPVDIYRARDAYFGHDSQDRFLYWMIDGRTIVLDKKTGAELVILPFLAGQCNSAAGEFIFCYKEDGIYRISMGDGAVTKIASEELYATPGTVQTIAGRDSFLVRRGGELLRAFFDSKSQALEMVRLQGTSGDSPVGRVFAVGQGAEGLLVTNTVEGNTARLRAFDVGGSLLWSQNVPVSDTFVDCAFPVYDSSSRIRYVGIRNKYRSSSSRTVAATVYGLYDDYNGMTSVRNTQGYPTEASRLLFGVEKEDGEVLVGLGAQWTYIADSGFNSGPVHGMPERTEVLGYAPAAGTAAPGAHADLCSGLNRILEYGVRSPGLLLLSTGANHQYQPAAAHTTHVVSVRETRESRMDRLKIRHLPEDPAKGFSKKLAGPFDPVALAREILDRPGDEAKTMILTTQTPEGSVSKPLQLRPGTEYYYEYTTTAAEDIFSVTVETSVFQPASAAEGGHYRVLAEYVEDFSGFRPGSPFGLEESRFLNGWYNAAHAYLYQGSNWKNRYLSADSDISFTVPEETLGVLSFDYDIRRDTGFMANYFALCKDGGPEMLWDKFVAGSCKGFYQFRHFLEPGEYVLRAYARGYGGRLMDYYTRLDNLRLVLVDPVPGPESPAPETPVPCRSALRQTGGLVRVEGRFTAPVTAAYYSPFRADVVRGVDGNDYAVLSGDPGRYILTVTLPPGQEALYLGSDIRSRPVLSNGKNYYNVSYDWQTYQWICMYNDRYPQSALSNIPREYRIAMENLTGAQTIRQYSSTYRGALGEFRDLEAVITLPGAPAPAGVESGRLLIQGEKACGENGRFGGAAEIAFCPGEEGAVRVGDFRIYTIEDGVRVYLEQNAFTAESMLQEWTAKEAEVGVAPEEEAEDPENLPVYAKGERVSFSMDYSDYEADPSKVSYWRYTHTPMNDGLHPLHGTILDAPIDRFYVDGKYVVEHWQEDDASRSGNSPWDKNSNVCIFTFYIGGTAAGAPWITHMGTDPAEVVPGDAYEICVGVDDVEKDVLELTTEVYCGEVMGLPFYTDFREGITADGTGRYPLLQIPVPEAARAGRYDVVAVVRDQTGAGLKHYRFSCASTMGIRGQVDHTPDWEANRVRFNQKWFGEDVDTAADFALYSALPSPRARGTNVFWPGERLCLAAQVGGTPLSVTATLADHPAPTCSLLPAGPADPAGETPYTGVLWSPDLWTDANTATPTLQIVRFTAIYAGGVQRTCDVPIIVDGDIGYWMLHRLY
jgi:hypothetical protein